MSSNDFFAAIEQGDVDALERIIGDDPSVLEARNPEGLSPIMVAAYYVRRAALERLLRASPTLDLWEASIVGAAGRVQEVLTADPSLVEARSPDGFTALHLAAFFGHPATARLLLQAGAKVSARTTNALDNQPLHAAAAGSEPKARLACLELLLDAGAGPNEPQSGGFTPLMSAAQNGDERAVNLLLARGADPTVTDDQARSAADHAAASGHEKLAGRLRERVG
jgi:ankyrin repeat protein